MIREEMETLILHGLGCEWDTAAMQLGRERKGLLKPLFAIRDFKGKWGTWSSGRREISLSSELVRKHPWDAVREVLLHEMAHQYADEVLCARHETDHGPGFKKACRLLRANPRAAADYPLLDQRLSDGASQKEGGIPARIRKLMALAQSSNRFEAEAAMNKAHELLRRYQVDFTTGPERDELISVFVGAPGLRHFREEYRIASLLQDFYFVCGIWVPAYVVARGRMGTVLEITGRTRNVKIARYVHGFVTRTIDVQWLAYNRKKRLGRYRKSDFALGIIDGFRKRLEQEVARQDEGEGSLSLMKIEDKELESEVAYRYPHLRRIKGRAVRRDERVLRDGMKIGRELVICRGIEERGGSSPKSLPPGKD
jgi:hypothetical protein